MNEIKLLQNSIKLSDEELEQVQKLASANFSLDKIALYLDQDKDLFFKEWCNPESELRLNYNRGQLEREFNLIDKQGELGESGNITAAQIWLKEKERVQVENIRNQCLFGE